MMLFDKWALWNIELLKSWNFILQYLYEPF